MLQTNKKKVLKDFYAADSSNRYLNADGQVKKFNVWAQNNNLNYRLVIKRNNSKYINFLLWFALGLVIVATFSSSLVFLKLLALPILIYVSINKLSKPRLEEISPDFAIKEPVIYPSCNLYASCDLTYRHSPYRRHKVNPDAVFVNEPVMQESSDMKYRGSGSVITDKVNPEVAIQNSLYIDEDKSYTDENNTAPAY